MKSTILTKVSTVTPRNFAQQFEWMQSKNNTDIDFLKRFVKLCHKNADTTTDDINTVTAFTSKGYYIYSLYSKHIVRTTHSDKKVYYEIN